MISGRRKELQLLDRVFQSKEAEFVTVYGRRRVGKTYLIREFFKSKNCLYFQATGIQHGTMEAQLESFTVGFAETFFRKAALRAPKNWKEAFNLLHAEIKLLDPEKKVVIFFDELPWMVTPRSSLMEVIDYYWNHYWAGMSNVIFIVCGSSASWLIQKIIYNKGGLHNRTTLELALLPFSLHETKDFLESKGIRLSNPQILELYMAIGGIPYYLRYIQPGLSAQQNIQHILFDKNAVLKDEFNKLFDSLFDHADAYKELVMLAAQKKEGMTRGEFGRLAELSSSGGTLTKKLNDLCDVGFLEEYVPWGRTIGEYYKVVDEYCLFFMHWIYPMQSKKFTSNYWMILSQRPSYYAWAGYAFEAVCRKHIDQIIFALHIPLASTYGSWQFVPRRKKDGDGAQVDLVIERFDNSLTLCEIKYTGQPFSINKEYAVKLNKVISIFREKTQTRKQIFLAMISANGLKETIYSEEMVSGIVVLDDLFKESR